MLLDASNEQFKAVQLLVKLTVGAEFVTGGGGLLTGGGVDDESLPPPHAERKNAVQLISSNFLVNCIINVLIV